jgi:hypothetical protein
LSSGNALANCGFKSHNDLVDQPKSLQDPRLQIVIIPGDVEYSGTPQAPR